MSKGRTVAAFGFPSGEIDDSAYRGSVDLEQGEVIDHIIGYLRDGVSVNLVGLRQSGRSQVARRVVDRLRELNTTVVTVNGVSALRDRPLVVLALAGVEIPAGSVASSVSGAVAGLSKMLKGERSVLVVDDSDDLDAVSCGAIVAARAQHAFPVLSLTRPAGRQASCTLTTTLQPGVRIALDPLDFDSLHRVVRRKLSGPVDSSTIAQIATMSGGMPGLVGAIVDTGRRTGTIVEDHAIWRATGDLWDGRLAQSVEPLVVDLNDEELDALTKLAYVGTTTVPKAQEIVADHLFARISELGLLQVAETPAGPLVGVFPPLVAEYLRRTGALVSRQGVFDGAEAEGSLTPRLTLTSSRAAILNVRIADYWRAEVETLRAAWSADPSIANAVPLLQALNATSAGPADFAAVIDNTRRTGTDQEGNVRFAEWYAAHRALVHDDFDGARKILADQAAAAPRYAAQLRTIEATLQLYIGPVPDAQLLAPAGPDEDPVGAQGIQLVRIGTAIAKGNTVEALDGLTGYTASHPVYAERHRVVAGLARVVHGDFDEGVEWALRAMAVAETGLNLGEIYGHAYVAALGLAFAGRLDDLDALLGPVLTLGGTTILSEHFQIGVIALAALSAGWRGRIDYGWSLSVQAETTGRRPGPYPGMLHGVTPTVADRTGSWDEAGQRLWAAVDERLSKGFTAAAIAVAITAAETLPDPDRAKEVVAQARYSQSPFFVALGEYIAATTAGDPDALAELADDLWNRGARLHAVKAMVGRAFFSRLAGDVEGSVRQAEEAWARSSELGQKSSGLFLRLGLAVGLSAREREIALMIADGLSSQKIASSLGLSVRTVENYLVGAYRKLSCEGRDDLVKAVTTWAVLE